MILTSPKRKISFFLNLFCSTAFWHVSAARPGASSFRTRQPKTRSCSCRRFTTHTGRHCLFLMAARQGATDSQIDALRLGLPHLTDPASLQDQSFGKQPQGIGIQAEQGKKRTAQATQTLPLLLAADAFAAALEAIPAEDWCRTWAAGRTIMLRRTSKRVKEVVDKMRLPAVVRLSRSFWRDIRNGTDEAKLEFVLRQLAAMTARSKSPHSSCRSVQ